MSDLCVDIGMQSLIKHGEQLCGDMVEVVYPDENTTVVVLADGLGSGVKANILATLTSKIISTMMAESMSIEECVTTIAETLPVCKIRGVAYSTFTVLLIKNNNWAEIIQYDNPKTIVLRKGKELEYTTTTSTIDRKKIAKAAFPIEEGDVFVLMSDGVISAGNKSTLNYKWQREDVVKFMEDLYPGENSAGGLNMMLINHCNSLYDGAPGDDTTACTVKIRKKSLVNLLFGPPKNTEDETGMLEQFFSKGGKHIVCGGTTSKLAADYLGKDIDIQVLPDNDHRAPQDIPPTAKIEGVDLVTEGVVTMSRVLDYAKENSHNNRLDTFPEWLYSVDGASQIAVMLFGEATDINFYVGTAVNPAHQDPEMAIGFNVKMKIVEELSVALKAMGKRVNVSYF